MTFICGYCNTSYPNNLANYWSFHQGIKPILTEYILYWSNGGCWKHVLDLTTCVAALGIDEGLAASVGLLQWRWETERKIPLKKRIKQGPRTLNSPTTCWIVVGKLPTKPPDHDPATSGQITPSHQASSHRRRASVRSSLTTPSLLSALYLLLIVYYSPLLPTYLPTFNRSPSCHSCCPRHICARSLPHCLEGYCYHLCTFHTLQAQATEVINITIMSTILSEVTKTITKSAAAASASSTASANRVTPQGGVLEGSNPSHYDSKNPIVLFIIQVRWIRQLG